MEKLVASNFFISSLIFSQQAQFQQMQQIAQMQQQFHQFSGANSASNVNMVMSPQSFSPSRRGRKPTDKKKRKRHTWVKRPTTAYLFFVSKYRETLKEAGEVVPKVSEKSCYRSAYFSSVTTLG